MSVTVRKPDTCEDCGARLGAHGTTSVAFAVTLPGGEVKRWKLCRACFALAAAAEAADA